MQIYGTITREQLARRLERERQLGRRIVFTNGCFDLLHVGHVRCLRKARALGDLLVVGVNSDRSVARVKGPGRPIVPEAERAEMVGALGCVDYVTLFDEETPEELISSVAPDILVKGGDWRPGEVVGREFVEERGGKVVIIPLEQGYSTSSLVERIRSCDANSFVTAKKE